LETIHGILLCNATGSAVITVSGIVAAYVGLKTDLIHVIRGWIMSTPLAPLNPVDELLVRVCISCMFWCILLYTTAWVADLLIHCIAERLPNRQAADAKGYIAPQRV
jgi:hypothetical protein